MSITDPPHPQLPNHTVTAIVVSHDGSRWLGETLEALLRQTRPVDRVVGVDNGSRDGSAALLTDALGSRAVLTLPRSTGFGEAVAEVLDRLGPGGGREWIWLLHDDCAPDVHALRLLLEAADEDPKAAVLGPKLRDWLDRRLLLEVGVTVDRTGRRDTGLEAREFDQGQYDGTRDVLSVSTAGMLIRRDVWEEVGGLDPALPLFRDDLDLCWRVRTAAASPPAETIPAAWTAATPSSSSWRTCPCARCCGRWCATRSGRSPARCCSSWPSSPPTRWTSSSRSARCSATPSG
jgi:GT2 family glycosyltransferase